MLSQHEVIKFCVKSAVSQMLGEKEALWQEKLCNDLIQDFYYHHPFAKTHRMSTAYDKGLEEELEKLLQAERMKMLMTFGIILSILVIGVLQVMVVNVEGVSWLPLVFSGAIVCFALGVMVSEAKHVGTISDDLSKVLISKDISQMFGSYIVENEVLKLNGLSQEEASRIATSIRVMLCATI